jgi:hypothetical protein
VIVFVRETVIVECDPSRGERTERALCGEITEVGQKRKKMRVWDVIVFALRGKWVTFPSSEHERCL